MSRRMGSIKTCLYCEKETHVESRGVCHLCYQMFRNMIQNGETTAEELEAAGLWLPVKERRGQRAIDKLAEHRSRGRRPSQFDKRNSTR
jgi:hypothetical protein